MHSRINIIIKPTRACNLKCRYCYDSADGNIDETMKLETFERTLFVASRNFNQIHFLWHGGEPLLAGYDFFFNVFNIQELYIQKFKLKVTNSIQTNCTLFTDDIVKLFLKYNVKIGVSFDGIDNEINRCENKYFFRGYNLLRENSIKAGAICVVTPDSIENIVENYCFFNHNEIPVNFNYVFPMGRATSNSIILDTKIYLNGMKKLFSFWIRDVNCRIRVEPFENLIRTLIQKRGQLCNQTSCLGRWIGVEPGGDMYPCNRHFPLEYKYGNVHEMNELSEIFNSSGFELILRKSIVRREKCIADCEYYYACEGGCGSNSLIENGLENNNGFSCLVFKGLFSFVSQAYTECGAFSVEEINPIANTIKNEGQYKTLKT